MDTALDRALARSDGLEAIPPITEPMGQYWKQPKRSDILIDATHAVMSRSTFNKLHEYSGSFPSGVYEGKMWKRHDGGFDVAYRRAGGKPVWKLVWFGKHADPDKVSNNFRDILIIEDGAPDEGCSCCLKYQTPVVP